MSNFENGRIEVQEARGNGSDLFEADKFLHRRFRKGVHGQKHDFKLALGKEEFETARRLGLAEPFRKSGNGMPSFPWAGALASLKGKTGAVELQHAISAWRVMGK